MWVTHVGNPCPTWVTYVGKPTVSSGTVQPDFKNKYDLDIYDLR